MDDDFGFSINRPFYIKSRMPMGRVMEAISANNVTLKKYVKGRIAQQWVFDGISKTVKSVQWKSHSLDKQGGNLTVRPTSSRWW